MNLICQITAQISDTRTLFIFRACDEHAKNSVCWINDWNLMGSEFVEYFRWSMIPLEYLLYFICSWRSIRLQRLAVQFFSSSLSFQVFKIQIFGHSVDSQDFFSCWIFTRGFHRRREAQKSWSTEKCGKWLNQPAVKYSFTRHSFHMSMRWESPLCQSVAAKHGLHFRNVVFSDHSILPDNVARLPSTVFGNSTFDVEDSPNLHTSEETRPLTVDDNIAINCHQSFQKQQRKVRHFWCRHEQVFCWKESVDLFDLRLFAVNGLQKLIKKWKLDFSSFEIGFSLWCSIFSQKVQNIPTLWSWRYLWS